MARDIENVQSDHIDDVTLQLLDDFRDKWEKRCSENVNATAFGHRSSTSKDAFMDRVRLFSVGPIKGIFTERNAATDKRKKILERSIRRVEQAIESIDDENFQIPNSLSVQENRATEVAAPLSQAQTFYILVPPAVSAVINLTNVAAFLNGGVYNEPSVQAFPSRPKEVIVSPKEIVGTVSQTFKVIDDPLSITEADWPNVVACFVLGKEWQFGGWFGRKKGTHDPVSHILTRIRGYYIALERENIPKNIINWNVSVIQIYRSKKDNLMARRIWDDILWGVNTEVSK